MDAHLAPLLLVRVIDEETAAPLSRVVAESAGADGAENVDAAGR
ncbi:MAG: hypothetical protein E6Z01_04165 [Actinomyces sp.]|nr:hypothetical protein [Actinomyces sp.]